MKRFIGMIAVAALIVPAVPAAAQMLGNPVYVPIGVGTGINIAGDYARGLNDASLKTNYFGGRATLGVGNLYVMAGVGSVKPDETLSGGAESKLSYGGTLGFHIIRLPLTPIKVSAQAGVGYYKLDTYKQIDLPIALAIGFSLPTPGFGITPWIAPRLHVRYQDSGASTQTKARFGGSGGVNVSIGIIGVHLAIDYLSIPVPEGAPGSSSDYSPWIFGGGLSLGLNVPGL
jgi:hypothetical protein